MNSVESTETNGTSLDGRCQLKATLAHEFHLAVAYYHTAQRRHASTCKRRAGEGTESDWQLPVKAGHKAEESSERSLATVVPV